jgi:hypothetical protein
MSLYFAPLPAIEFNTLMGGWLEPYGIRAVTSGDDVWLETEYGSVLVRGAPGKMCSFAYLTDAFIADAIRDEFDVELVTEHDPRYHGFQTEEEYIAWRRSPDWVDSDQSLGQRGHGG